MLLNTYVITAGQISALALLALLCPLALEGTVHHALILHRKGHGDAQLPVLLHGTLDGLISVGVSRPAATGHLRQPGNRSHGSARGFTSRISVRVSHPVGNVPVQHQTGASCRFIRTVQQQTEASIDYFTPAGGNQE